MNVEVRTWPAFDDALTRLRRKYPRIDEDVRDAFQGDVGGRLDALPGYSHRLWKYRIASRDMQRGKRGGFRVILYMDPRPETTSKQVHLLTIYAKSERRDIPNDELLRLWTRFQEYVRAKR